MGHGEYIIPRHTGSTYISIRLFSVIILLRSSKFGFMDIENLVGLRNKHFIRISLFISLLLPLTFCMRHCWFDSNSFYSFSCANIYFFIRCNEYILDWIWIESGFHLECELRICCLHKLVIVPKHNSHTWKKPPGPNGLSIRELDILEMISALNWTQHYRCRNYISKVLESNKHNICTVVWQRWLQWNNYY